ncbi:hypothetical protein EDC02_1473 [Micromonospora sp. Llam0]|uniref:hypothetical protein n=1 Tax=Micromonospora sp. Llam0 TaxID=2485143 RepID=UPI000F47C3CB|nr:hypothetical protein [Micromonospora sp. Llam0]ROO59666.1 hypothetical protein EDC02_1473 [Micromonospora sp. Llam0]
MPRWRRARLIAGAAIAALAVAACTGGESHWGWFLALTVGLPYAVLAVPTRCGESLWDDGDCPYLGSGLLVGCHLHRLDKMERLLGAQPRTRAGSRLSGSPAGVPADRAPAVARHVREGLGFVVALLGVVSGLLILLGLTSAG